MSSLTIITDKIAEILLATSGVGTLVYKYEVYTDDWAEFINKFKTDDKVKGFEVYRRATPEATETSRTNKRDHNFLIRGYYSLGGDGVTMIAFQALVEAIATAFRTKPDLDGTTLTNTPLQIDVIENRMFGSVLCHYLEARIIAEVEEQWTEN